MILSEKYKAFLRCDAKVEFLEGTTSAGKTTVGAIKFMLRVAASDKKQHILSGLDTGTIEKNIINKDLGLLDIFGSLLTYHPSGGGDNTMPHLRLRAPSGEKIIYVLGYDNKARWKKALGGQYGCLYIDEINIADMEYVRESTMRCDYMIATLNPDDPSLPVYKEYINHARPLTEYADDAPPELLSELNETPKEGWTWWYFSFEHNAGLTPEKRKQIIESVPVGTKLYKNKIQGLRGRSTGLVFCNFERKMHIISISQAKSKSFIQFSAGLDTAYSTKSPDTIAMSYIGITAAGELVVLAERTYNNATLDKPLAPSDTVHNFIAFLDACGENFGPCRDCFIDSADQATIQELHKYKASHGCVYNFFPAWKKMRVIDRINSQLGWLATGCFFVVDTCRDYIRELETYSWREDRNAEPEDANDHMINSVQYAFIPYKMKIGAEK